MTETLLPLLLRLSEGGAGARLPGFLARRHFGPAFDGLLRAGVLEELEPAETWPVCPDCDCGLDARPIAEQAGVLTATCPYDADADVRLHDDDCRMFGIHEQHLVAAIVGATGALPEPLPGLWHLGRKLVGYELFLALRRGVLADPALPSVILRQAQGRAALVSPGPPSAQVVPLREAGIPLLPVAEVVGVTDASGAHLDEPAIVRLLRGGAGRLEIREAGSVVLVDGSLQHVPERPFALLLLLARHTSRGTMMKASEFEIEWQRSASDVLRELKRALSKGRANAAEIEGWFIHRRTFGSYVLTLDTSQVVLLP